MDISPYVVLGSAIAGLLVGLTGAGGGALMTAMLIGAFHVRPPAAISSDLVAAVVMRPVGAAVHIRRGTVNWGIAGWMCAGSVPMAFPGAYLLHVLAGTGAGGYAATALGAALLAGTAALAVRAWLDRGPGARRRAVSRPGTQARPGTGIGAVTARPVITLLIGAAGGLIVGMTSAGSGSVMSVLLLFAYPALTAGELVGTDLAQAVPLTAAAALGAMAFGHVEPGLTAGVIAGGVPAAYAGSLLSSRVPDAFIRPVITFVIFVTGLKYAGLGTAALGWTAAAAAAGGCAYLLACCKGDRSRIPGAARLRAPAGHPAGAGESAAPD
jgi:uncharacterized membrane protein YfcA